MLAQLLTLKARLGLEAFDPTDDAGLNNLIKMVSARFAAECNRIFDYGAGVMFEFRGDEMNIMVDRPPIEQVSKFVRSLSFEQLVSAIYKAYPRMKANSVFRG